MTEGNRPKTPEEIQAIERDNPGATTIEFLSQHWNSESRIFEIPSEETFGGGEWFQPYAFDRTYDDYHQGFKNDRNPRSDFPEGAVGDREFEEASEYNTSHNINLARYLKSLGWTPEDTTMFFHDPDILTEVWPELLER